MHEKAHELRHLLPVSTCTRRGPLRDDIVQLEELMGQQRYRKRLSMNDPSKHLELRVPGHFFLD